MSRRVFAGAVVVALTLALVAYLSRLAEPVSFIVPVSISAPLTTLPPTILPVTALAPVSTLRSGDCLVMAMATNYDMSVHRRFVYSLRETGYNGGIVIGVKQNMLHSREFMAFCEAENVQAVSVDNVRGVPSSVANIPATARFWWYKKWSNERAYRLVLAIDYRDTFFQSDPFKSIVVGNEWLRFYEEVFPPGIKDSFWTHKWIQQGWGTPAADKLGKHPTLCSGGIVGTPAGFAHLCDTMTSAIITHPNVNDQGTFNYLFYTGKFERVRVLKAGHAEVYHIGFLGQSEEILAGGRTWRIDDKISRANGTLLVLNEDGKPAPVVHQFDRFSVLVEYANAKWK